MFGVQSLVYSVCTVHNRVHLKIRTSIVFREVYIKKDESTLNNVRQGFIMFW